MRGLFFVYIYCFMNPQKQYVWTDEDTVVDYTKPLKKLWDKLIPSSFPEITSFTTEGAKWVEHKKVLGPYHAWEEDLKFLVEIVLNQDPLIKLGWNGKDTISKELFNKAYGENFFYNVRQRMVEVAKHVGLNLSQFDLEGDFKVFVF